MVYLIGAGPGDFGLTTIKALESIKKADCIIYDRLANKMLLEYAKEGAEVIYVGKKGGSHILPQSEINNLIVRKARQGKVVARLKGGDPFIFGRGGEEALVLAEEGLPFEVVSGVTSPIAAPTYAGIPLTHRDYSSTVAFITGHEDPDKKGTRVAWDKISTGAGTLVFLMGTKNLSRNVKKLMENGRAPDTPVAVIRWGTRPEQETVTGTLKDIVAKAGDIKPPTVMVVGEVVRLRERLNWFETRPLFGKRVLITRTKEQAGEFSDILRGYGAEPIEYPTIEIGPPDSWKQLDKALNNIEQYNWIIFTSVNGVRFFVKRLKAVGKDIRILKGIKICTIGPRTAKGVEDLGINVDLLPERYIAEAIIDDLGKEEIKDRRFLLPRAMKAREVLPEEIERYGGKIDVVTVYKTTRPERGIAKIRGLLRKQAVDVVTFTSSSTVTNFVEGFEKGEAQELLSGIDVACIGPVTAGTARSLGIETAFMPEEYTIPALVEEMVNYFQRK
ncbi:MAG: uroporphyrinogen-III C-methyltransferase [Thermodesulfobacteriota bacterium]